MLGYTSHAGHWPEHGSQGLRSRLCLSVLPTGLVPKLILHSEVLWLLC